MVVADSLLTLFLIQVYDVGVFEVFWQLPLLPEGLEQAGQPVDDDSGGISSGPKVYHCLHCLAAFHCLLSCWALVKGGDQRSGP